MTDEFDVSSLFGGIGSIIAALLTKPRAPRQDRLPSPKLKVIVCALRQGRKKLWISVEAVNVGDAPVTLAHLVVHLSGPDKQTDIYSVIPARFQRRLESNDSTKWQKTVRLREPWMAGPIDLKVSIAGGDYSASNSCAVSAR